MQILGRTFHTSGSPRAEALDAFWRNGARSRKLSGETLGPRASSAWGNGIETGLRLFSGWVHKYVRWTITVSLTPSLLSTAASRALLHAAPFSSRRTSSDTALFYLFTPPFQHLPTQDKYAEKRKDESRFKSQDRFVLGASCLPRHSIISNSQTPSRAASF